MSVWRPNQYRATARLMRRFLAARTSLVDFVETTCKDDHGSFLRCAPIHQQWVFHIQYCWSRGLKALIVAPFGHGKSSSFAVPLIAHCLGIDPNLRVKVITNDDSGARKRVAAVKKIIESKPYQLIFPRTRPGGRWTDHELYLKRPGHAIDPSVQARGVLTTGIGGRADIEIFDDAVDQKNSYDQAQRAKVLSLIESTWISRLEPDGFVLYVDTLWHLDDATHHLMQRSGWCTLIQEIAPDCSRISQRVMGTVDNDYRVITEPGVFRPENPLAQARGEKRVA